MFVQDALQALHSGEVSKAIERTSLARQQLTSSPDRNEITPATGPKTPNDQTEPKSMLEIPKPPLTLQTQRGTYFIRLYWDPPVIQVGNTTKFGILFLDRSQSILNQVTYSFRVKDASGYTIAYLNNQKAPQGTGVQSVIFNRPGPVEIIVSIDSIPGKFARGLAYFVDFPVVVNRGTSNNTAYSGNATGVSSPANSGDSTVTFKVGHKDYPVKYQITGGKVTSVAIEKDNSTLVANISTTSNGTLTIELPRNVIDSKNPGDVDDKYVVFIDGQNVAFDEINKNNQVRTLKIDFDDGAQQIGIAGTHVIGQIESKNKSSTDMMTPSKSNVNSPSVEKQTDRYYQGLNWSEVCNNPLLHSYIAQSCDLLVTPDKNALTSKGKVVLEGILCPRGESILSTLELFYGTIPDKLKNDLAVACGWH